MPAIYAGATNLGLPLEKLLIRSHFVIFRVYRLLPTTSIFSSSIAFVIASSPYQILVMSFNRAGDIDVYVKAQILGCKTGLGRYEY